MERRRAYSGAPWEKRTGYCRATRVGSHILVSGTAPVAEDGSTFSPGDGYRQSKRSFEIVERALRFRDVMDGDDVRMVEAGGGAQFLDEAIPPIGIEGEVRRQELDRDASLEPLVGGSAREIRARASGRLRSDRA